MTRYTCGFFPRILAIIPATRYTCVFLPRILAFFPALWGFYSQVYDHFLTNAHIYAHKKSSYICVTNKHAVRVTESPRIRDTELYRQQKTFSCTMDLKSNFSLNQEWPQSQFRNTVRKDGKYRNTASKIVKIPIPHILITFIISSAYLWLLPSRAFNYLRHLCIRCPCFF